MAVYTHVNETDLTNFLSKYDAGNPISFKGIAEGVENSNYFLDTDQGRFILTLYEKRVDEQDLPFFLSLMGHMADQGLPSARPILARDGKIIQQLCGKAAALIEFVPGLSRMKPDISDCGQMGAMLGQAHRATGNFPKNRNNNLSVSGWRALGEQCHDADRYSSGLSSLIMQEIDYVGSNWPNLPDMKSLSTKEPGILRSGVIHADFFPDNVMFRQDGQISGLIDFYFSCTDFYVYDLAICINAWCFDEDHRFQKTHAQAFIAAYQQQHPLYPTEIDALPLMLRGAALRFLLTRTYDWLNQVEGALVNVKDPLEYQRKLLFHQSNPIAVTELF